MRSIDLSAQDLRRGAWKAELRKCAAFKGQAWEAELLQRTAFDSPALGG